MVAKMERKTSKMEEIREEMEEVTEDMVVAWILLWVFEVSMLVRVIDRIGLSLS